MAFPLTVAKAVFKWDLVNNSEGINVLHFKKFGGGDFGTTDCQDLAVSLHDWYSNANFKTETNTSWKANLDNTQSLLDITVSDVGPGPSVQYVETVNEVGGLNGTPLPVEASMVTTWRTLQPGRSGRGRTFWSGLDTSSLDDSGGFAPATVAVWQATMNALINGFLTEGIFEPSVFSPLHSVAYGITAPTVQSIVHHQRRRNT